jgi:hypothetical protein
MTGRIAAGDEKWWAIDDPNPSRIQCVDQEPCPAAPEAIFRGRPPLFRVDCGGQSRSATTSEPSLVRSQGRIAPAQEKRFPTRPLPRLCASKRPGKSGRRLLPSNSLRNRSQPNGHEKMPEPYRDPCTPYIARPAEADKSRHNRCRTQRVPESGRQPISATPSNASYAEVPQYRTSRNGNMDRPCAESPVYCDGQL